MIPELNTDSVRLLVDIGFLALSANRLDEASAIFKGVAAARPEGEAGPLGLAMTALAAGDTRSAVQTLRALPPSDAALTYLGLALLRQGERVEARRVLADVADTALDPAFAELARGALADMDAPPRG